MSNLAYKVQEEEQQQQQVRKKHKPKAVAITKAEKAILVFFVGSTFLLLVQYLSVFSETYTVNLQNQEVQAQMDNIKKTNQDLKTQVDQLSSPNRVVQIAEKKGLQLNTGNVKATAK